MEMLLKLGLIWFLSERWISIAIICFRLRLSSLDKPDSWLRKKEMSITCLCGKNICIWNTNSVWMRWMPLCGAFFGYDPVTFRMSGLPNWPIFITLPAHLSKVVEAASMEQVKRNCFWRKHQLIGRYTSFFSKPSPRRQKHLSEDSSTLFFINTVVPVLCMLTDYIRRWQIVPKGRQLSGSHWRQRITTWSVCGRRQALKWNRQPTHKPYYSCRKNIVIKRIVFVAVLVTSTSSINKSALLILFSELVLYLPAEFWASTI